MIKLFYVVSCIFLSIMHAFAYADTVWESNQILGQNGVFDFAGIYEFENLTIHDNVHVFSTNISQLVLKINGKLKLGKNVSIRVRNGFYPEAPENTISQLTETNLFVHGFMWNGIQLFPNMFGQGGDGGDSSDENNGSNYKINGITYYLGAGGPGGGGFGGGTGGKKLIAYGLTNASNNGGNAIKGGNGWNGQKDDQSIQIYGGTGGSGGGKKNLGEHGGSGTDFTYASGGGGGGGNGGNGGFGGNGDRRSRNGGRGGGGGGYGGGILSIFAHSIAYDENAPPKFIVSGQKGGDGEKSGENGEGGLLIIEAAHYTQSTSHYNLYASTYGEHIVPSNNGGHGIVSGSPQKVFVYKQRIYGTVTDLETGDPLSGVQVNCEYCDSDATDYQGHYTLYPEKSGDHEIIFSKSGYESLHIPISSGSQQLNVNITVPGFVSIVTDELPVTEIEKPYHIKIRIKGGHFPYTYQLIKGELPNGLTFNAETGDITGVCTIPGNYHFTIQVVDINNIPIEKSFTLDVSQILELVTEPVLPRATKGTSYGFQIEAVGGFPPYHFSYASTITPPGLNISTDGIIGYLKNNDEVLYLSETFDTQTVPDNFIMNGQYYPYITDDQRLQFGNISDNRTSQIQLNFQSLTEATLKFDFQVSSESGYDYLKIIINNQTIESWSGNESGNYSCELSQGLNTIIWQYSKDGSTADGMDTAWIDNIMILSTNASIGSVPTQAGQYTFTVFVTDDRNQTTQKEYFLDIAAPLAVSPSRLDHGIVGNAYTQTISISGGYGDYHAELTPNLLPEGLLFNPETFTISGIPAAPASITFVFEYFDSENRTGKTIFDLVINDPLQIAHSMLPHGFVNQNYSQVIGQTGGYPPFSFHCKDSLPPGLSLDTVQGCIEGTPSTEGLMYVNIVVTDSSYPIPQAYTKLMSIRTLLPHEIEKPIQKSPYSYQLLSDASTICELSGGSLPTGLTLNTQTGVLSGIPMHCGNFYFIIDAYTDRYTDYYAYSLDVECCDSCYELSGRVSQETDVIVTLTGDTSYTTTTDENGYYQFNHLANGQYTIHARKPNYWIDPLFHDIIVDNLDKNDIHFTATANKAPLTPVAEMPLHDSNGIALTSTQLQWSCVDLDNMDMMVYDVYFGNTHALDLLVYGISEQSVNIETQLANATSYFWKVIARDSFGAATASPLWQFETVNSDDKYIKIITLELPVTENNKFYSEKIMAKGGAYPYTFSIQSGELPPGLVIHERYGFISGQLTKTGSYYFTVQVMGSDHGKPGNITEKELHIEVTNELNIITQNQLPRATLGQTYEFSIEAVGGREPYVFQYHPRHEKGYELSSYRHTWSNAKESCENNNGYLVTIDSFEEYNTVKRLAENAGRDAWIGLSRDYSGSDWEWVSNEPVTFDYWYDINSYYKYNCAYLYANKDYQWYNQNCLTEEYFICEYNVINGLSLESSGKLTGVPNNYRDYTVTIIVTDASGRQDEQDFVLTIDMPLEISNTHQGRLNDGIVLADYYHKLNASGGFGKYYWDIYSGQLPDGLVLDNETGIISGQPINATYRSVVISVSDESNRTTFNDLTFEISEPLEIQTIALDDAFRDKPYSEIIKLKPLSGISPYQYIIDGDLPEGLSLDQSTGKIEGTPESSGLFNFDIVVTDSSFPEKQSIRKFFQLNVTTEYMIFAASTLQGNKDDTISMDLGVGGGNPPYEWSIFSGYLPGGVNIESDGSLKGRLEDIGDYQFTLQVVDATGDTQKKEFTWNVLDELKIVTQIVPEGDTQSDYGFQLQAKGGLKPYSWRLLTDSGNLPDGITLLETGWIYGRPQGAQPRTFEVEVSDSSIPQQRTTKSYRIEIMDDFYISTMRLENGKRDAPYSDQILAALGTPPYQWKLDSGTLPPGLVFQETVNNAMIEGIPTSEGTFTFVIAATDAGTPVNHYTREFTIKIYAGLRIINDKLSTAQRGILYSDNIEPKGGELPYHYEIADGELPAGLNLNSLIGKISGITNLDTGYSAEFVIKVTDSGNPASVIEKDFTINVTDPVSIETQSIRDALQKKPYIAQLEGKGGYAPYAWSVSSGRLPDGLQLVSNTAQILGTPKTCGDFNFTVQMVDASLMPITVTQAYQLIVKCCNNYHITGVVSEMPGVVISISNKANSYTTTTDETGVYTFNNLQSGDYHVQILEQRCWANEPKSHDVILLNQDIGGVDFSARWNQLPLLASNPSPITSNKSVSLNPVLSWTGKDMDTQDLLTYDIYFGMDQHPSLLVSNLSESTFALEKLAANTKYYWQVKSKDTKKGITDGPIWSFTTLNHAPNQPESTFPEDTASDVQLNIVLSWTCDDPDPDDPIHYNVLLGTALDDLHTIVQTSDSHLEVTLNANTRYYWQILAHDSHEGEQISPVWSFTTLNRSPEISETVFPANNQENTNLDIYLSWECFDPDQADSLLYDIYFGTTAQHAVVRVDLTQTSYDPGLLMPNTKYYWKIHAKDSHDAIDVSPVFQFTTLNRSPNEASSPSPAHDAKRILLNTHLSWTGGDLDINDSVVYDIYFGKTQSELALLSSGQSMTEFYPENLQTNTSYYWQIISRDNHASETKGPVWQFKTIAPGFLSFESKQINVFENQGSISIHVIRNNGNEGEIAVDFETIQGTAMPLIDYTPASGTLIFADGEQIKSFVVNIKDDYRFETNETLNLLLKNPTDQASLGFLNQAVLTIMNDPSDIKAGDIDGNNDVNLSDAILILKILSEFSGENPRQHADTNGDDRLDLYEVLYIFKLLMQ